MAETGSTQARFCSQCGRPVVVAEAMFCKECGARLGVAGWLGELNAPAPVAFVLSLVPGLGHFYAGRTGRARLASPVTPAPTAPRVAGRPEAAGEARGKR